MYQNVPPLKYDEWKPPSTLLSGKMETLELPLFASQTSIGVWIWIFPLQDATPLGPQDLTLGDVGSVGGGKMAF